ncbi:MAG: class II aldolase/adducin family protein [Eubacterium sp.]|nr:class II aldolase/adducin family protein [Eubacterium sp.]
MDKKIALKEVAETGRILLKEKLVARTWGNFSAKIGENRCVITPSGLGYENMEPKDLVELDINTGESVGIHKPSGEKAVHMAAYKVFKDAEFVIHTHQIAATAIGLGDISSLDLTADENELLGGVNIAAYGMPGSDELGKNVEEALKNNAMCILMAHHGVLIVASSREEAIKKALLLEKICERNLKGQSNVKYTALDELFKELKSLCEGKHIIQINSSNVLALAERDCDFWAQIDDMAMMIGEKMPICAPNAHEIMGLLKDYGAVLVKGYGAFALTEDEEDAAAAGILIEKAATAALHAKALGVNADLDRTDAAFMRKDYITRYSKEK